MKVSKILNTSKTPLQLNLSNDVVVSLSPNSSISNVDVTNLDEVKGSATITMDLTEVNESKNIKTVRLLD